jgi:glycosyltransferase involved in cell wall biosynthesis
MQKAAVVFHTTNAVREEIERHGLVDPKRLVQAPLGVAPEFTPYATESLPAELERVPFVLHVGSCIPRKRIDVLLDVFAAVRHQHPELRLVKVGGPWTPAQREQMNRLKLGSAVRQLTGLERAMIAALYRAAAVVLLPSEAEGFGLPLLEALACGAAVVASDIPVLREVGGDAAIYRPVGNVEAWADAVRRLLDYPSAAPPVATRLARARQFTWANHCRIIAHSYRRILGLTPTRPPNADATTEAVSCASST